MLQSEIEKLNAEASILDDDRIVSVDDDANFFELVNGEWVEPTKGFTAAEYWNSRELSESETEKLPKPIEK